MVCITTAVLCNVEVYASLGGEALVTSPVRPCVFWNVRPVPREPYVSEERGLNIKHLEVTSLKPA
jgi:hypothetical protein